MGKSLRKWIKALIGKRSSRSHASNTHDATKTTIDRGYFGRRGPTAADGNSPVISDPTLVNTERNGVVQAIEGTSSQSAGSVELKSSVKGGPAETNGSENSKEEQAAIKAQAAFRGYLAHRTFRALKGIIRLQAVVRRHLVQRQAISTLRAMHGIVQFQSFVRGWKVGRSCIGLEVSKKYHTRKDLDLKNNITWREKVSTNIFIHKLVYSTVPATPLRVKYHDQGLPNSVMSWMERWSSSCFWKPLSRPKKTIQTKTQRRSNYTTRTELGRSNRVVRKNTTSNTESGLTNVISGPERSGRVMRKISSSPADAMQELESELEKVKRDFRRVKSCNRTSC